MFTLHKLISKCAVGGTLVVAICGVLANPAYGAPLYAADQSGNLYMINTTNGAGTFIGQESGTHLSTELVFDLSTGTLYSEGCDPGIGLHAIDTNTGLSTECIGHSMEVLTGLEFVGTTLYATTAFGSGCSSALEMLNLSTGNLTPIGPTLCGTITGLAYDARTDTMFAVEDSGGPAMLFTMNRATGLGTPRAMLFCAQTGLQLTNVGSIEFASDGVLYGAMDTGASINPGWLFRINTTTGACTFIGPTGLEGVSALASPEPAFVPTLIGSDASCNLFRINTQTGVGTFIGNDATYPLAAEIEVDPATGRLYSEATNESGTIHFMNAGNGQSVEAVTHTPVSFQGLEYIDGMLFGACTTHVPGEFCPSSLEMINPLTGITSHIGQTGFGCITGLAYHNAQQVLYAVTGADEPATLITIDPVTGTGEQARVLFDIGSSSGLTHVGSIEFAADGRLYGGMDLDANIYPGWLFRIDPATGGCVFIGPTGFDGITGLADPTSICTGDINGDRIVDVNDISSVLFRIGAPCMAPGCPGDVNTDGIVNVNDITFVLFEMGKVSP